MSDHKQSADRPLSPHLQVYRLPLTALMSISHRASGYALSLGTAMIVWMLVAAAIGPEAYGVFYSFVGSWVGQLMIFGWSVALFYHMSNGVRHLFWDMGYFFKLENAAKSGYVVIASTIILTALTWWFACPWHE